MPYTRKQVKYLLSSVSPLTEEQQDKVKAELHADPSLGHAKKKTVKPEGETHHYNWRRQRRQF